MHLVPIPTDARHLAAWEGHWFPWLEKLSRNTGDSLEELVRMVLSHEAQVALIWDDDNKQARALIGIRYCRRGDDFIGDIIWTTGENMKAWRQLLPQLEAYLRDHVGCTVIRPICRPGWWPFLKANGYKIAHYQTEKRLWAPAADRPP